MSCGVGHRHCSHLALLCLWCRLAAAALIRPLAWEPPYAASVALKRQKKKKRNNPNYPTSSLRPCSETQSPALSFLPSFLFSFSLFLSFLFFFFFFLIPGSEGGGGLGARVSAWVPNYPHHYRKYTVHLGEHSLQNKDGPEQKMSVAQSIPHPCYNSSSEDRSHDLMLVRLRGRASLGPKVKPIKLADHCPQAGQKCTISGWGTITSPQGSGREKRSLWPQWTPSHWQSFASRSR